MKSKQCTKCKKIWPLAKFNKQKKTKSGLRNDCKACQSSYYKIYYNKNKVILSQNCKKWSISNREKYLAGKNRYNTKHRISIRKKANETARKKSIILTDCYIKSLIAKRCNLKNSDIPQKLIKAKRQYIKLYRRLKDE